MKKIFLFSFFFAFSVSAQKEVEFSQIESLKKEGQKFYYTQKDSAYYYFDKVYAISKKNNDTENLIEALFSFAGIASYNHDLKKMGAAIKELEDLLKTYEDFDFPTADYNINVLYYYKGTYQLLLSDNISSRRTFQKIIKNIKNIPEEQQTATLQSLMSASYSFLGKIYLKENKYELAKEIYANTIRGIEENDPKNFDALYGNYNLIAEVYQREQKYMQSNRYLIKTFEYNKTHNNTNAAISTAFYLSENYNKIKKQDSALFYLSQAKLAFNENPVFYHRYHLIKSAIHKNLKEYHLALNELETSLKEIQTRFDGERNIDQAIVLNQMGLLHEILNNDEKANFYYVSALKELNKDFKNHIHSIKISKNLAELLNKKREENSYFEAIKTVDKAVLTLDVLKPTFKNQEDKLFLIENAFPLFESGLEAAYQVFKVSSKDTLVDLAFNYSEKSKSILLLEALLGAKATQFANIPNDILERELQLKSEITFVEKQLNQNKETDPEKEDELFALQEDYRQLIQNIDANYSTYYDLKYNTAIQSISGVQKLLAKNEKLISYFYGNGAIYAIGIAKNSKHIERISIDGSLENEIGELHRMLGNPKSDLKVLSKVSYRLYDRLVAPFLTSETHQKLIIVADGLLNYIPFGALNISEKNPAYLMEKYAVSYANSATLYAQLLERNTAEGDLLAFAPSFNGEQVQIDPSRDSLLPLPHNKREVAQILTSFEGRSFVDENASLQNFTSELSNFSILHLATHAVFDDASPEYSYLAFANDKEEENMLYVSDLYNLQIKADLVTLSACETGIGELKRGEGFVSLARGFFYSGASSIASTLWKVNDASATTLMDSFYKNLSDGNTKDIALQKAKQKFLKTNRQNGLAHPYYWSGFIISGNASAVVETNYFVWIVLIGLALFLVGFLVFRKKRMH
ncbi:MAG: CHAT domain-containing protein [Maribacter sp.]